MSKSRFTEEQMVEILCEAQKSSVTAVAKISEEAIYAWRQHLSGLELSDGKTSRPWRPRTRR